MSGQIAGEGWFMLHSFLLGVFITLFYDLFRILRRIFHHGAFLLSMEDLAFWVLATAGIFYLLYYENNGMFRWFAIIGAGVGMCLYKKTISDMLVNFVSGIINRLLHLVGRVIWKILAPFRFVAGKCRKMAVRAARRSERELRRCRRKINSRLTAWRKAFRIKICRHKKRRKEEDLRRARSG